MFSIWVDAPVVKTELTLRHPLLLPRWNWETGEFKLTGSAVSCRCSGELCPWLSTSPSRHPSPPGHLRQGKQQQNWRCLQETIPLPQNLSVGEMKEKQQRYMKSATHQTQRGRNSLPSQPCLQKGQLSGLFPPELHKQRQEERNGDHSKSQLSCFRFIFPQGTIVKISNPLCIKQSRSGFHFPISAISQKGDQNRISENQDGNGGLGSNLCSGREQQCSGACQPGLWVACCLAQQGRNHLPVHTGLPSLPQLTFRNLYSRNVNQFVSIFSATDSVL